MSEHEPQQPVIRDKRRVDPVTGRRRDTGGASPLAPPSGGVVVPDGSTGSAGSAAAASSATAPAAGAAPAATPGEAAESRLAALERSLAERTADVQRVQADYANYRRRVERDRDVAREVALAGALSELLPVLDDIGRAREHGDLSGAFRAVGEALEQAVTKLGLVRYADVGDAFDPTVHEALLHTYSDEVDRPTCTAVILPGYRLGQRVVRAARVAVAEPTVALPADPPAPAPTDR